MENTSGVMIVEVFKTNVTYDRAAPVLDQLKALMPSARINFDLDDCDRILRIEAESVCPQSVIDLLSEMEVYCEVLEG